MRASGVFAVLAVVVLVAVVCMRWQYERDRNSPPRITVTIVERPVVIPPAVSTSAGRTVTANPFEQARIESLTARARRADALEDSLRMVSQPYETVHSDKVSVDDSLGSFYAERVDSIRSFPPEKLNVQTTTWKNARFTSKHTEIEQMIPEPPTLREAAIDALQWVGWILFTLKLFGVI